MNIVVDNTQAVCYEAVDWVAASITRMGELVDFNNLHVKFFQ